MSMFLKYVFVVLEITDSPSECLFRCMLPHLGMSMQETMEDILVLSLELSTLSICKVTFHIISLG